MACPTQSRSSSTACWCRTSSAREAQTPRSGRWPSRLSCTCCSRCCCCWSAGGARSRWSPTVTLVVAAVGIVGPHIAKVDTFVIQSPPDLAALFAVGILSAGIVGASTARRSWPWAWLALAAAVPVLATIWWQGSVWTLHHLFWVDIALGPAIACLLAGLATGLRPRSYACWTPSRSATSACLRTACT